MNDKQRERWNSQVVETINLLSELQLPVDKYFDLSISSCALVGVEKTREILTESIGNNKE